MADDIRQVVEALGELEPSPVPALRLFEQLTGPVEPSVEDLIALEPEIEVGLIQLEDMANKSREMVKRCLELQPIPGQTVPRGF